MVKDTTLPKFKNKPLKEAIFELRWELKEKHPNVFVDSNYKLLVGSFFNEIKKEYKNPEALPASNMPEEIAAYLVQHRFRKDTKYPLIQIGPGIMSYNENESYDWEVFEKGTNYAVQAFYSSYPKKEDIKIKQIVLRYINALPLNTNTQNVLLFLRDKLKIDISLPEALFKDTGVSNLPKATNFFLTFPATKPKCDITFRFGTGVNNNKEKVLFWENIVNSNNESSVNNGTEIRQWVSKAHNLLDDWFFKLIEGDLLKEFK